MPSRLIQDLEIAGRILAGVVGCVCSYIGLFMFEDEEGNLQNKVELLWIRIDDRANVTRSKFVAIFNTISKTVEKALDRLFGKNLASITSLGVSLYLSIGASNLAMLTMYVWMIRTYSEYPQFATLLFHNIVRSLLMGPIALAVALVLAQVPKPMRIALTSVALVYLLVWPLAQIAFVWVPGIHSSRLGEIAYFFESTPLALLLSVMVDYTAVLGMRKIFRSLSDTLSIIRIVIFIAGLIVFALVVCILPTAVYVWKISHNKFVPLSTPLVATAGFGLFNISTAFLCLIPAFMLSFLVIHKLGWPSLSRLVYPLSRHRLVANKKILIPIGVLCFAHAFNLAKETGDLLRDVLKEFVSQ